jgi:hypothetical protein
MTKTKRSYLITSAMGLMFVLLVAQASVTSANAVLPSDLSKDKMSPEQIQNLLASVGINLPLGSLPVSGTEGGPDIGGEMLSQQPSEIDDDATEGANEEEANEEEQSSSMETDDEDDDSEY